MFALIHKNGCGKMVVNMVARPSPRCPVDVHNLRHLDGSLVGVDEAPYCESCGESIGNEDFRLDFILEFASDAPRVKG